MPLTPEQEKLDTAVLEQLTPRPVAAVELSRALGLTWGGDTGELRESLLRLQKEGKADVQYGRGWYKRRLLQPDNQPDLSEAPQALQDTVAEWLEDHPDHVVMRALDSQDVLILSDTAQSVVWVDPTGHAKSMTGRWTTVIPPREE